MHARPALFALPLAVALSALAVACSKPADAPAPVEAVEAVASTGPVGVVVEERQPALLSEVGEVGLPPAEAPASWQAGWRLKPGASWRYGYQQRITAEMDGAAAGKVKQGMEVRGTLVVSATSESVADVELTEAKSILTMAMPGGPEQKVEEPLPAKKYAGLLTTTNAPEQPEDPLVYAILAVPATPSAVGEAVTQPLAMPIDGPEGTLRAEGTATWTLKGFVKCGAHTCAHYTHDVDIAKLTPPEGAKGSYGARARAIGWTLVDVDDGALYRHKSATHLRLAANVPAGTASASPHGAASQPATPAQPQVMDMTQEHFHELVRALPAAEAPAE